MKILASNMLGLVLVLMFVKFSSQHIVCPPVYNYNRRRHCDLAAACVHDGVRVCGLGTCSGDRQFLDQCDLHEFNCEQNTDYITKDCGDVLPKKDIVVATKVAAEFVSLKTTDDDYFEKLNLVESTKTEKKRTKKRPCNGCNLPFLRKTTKRGKKRNSSKRGNGRRREPRRRFA